MATVPGYSELPAGLQPLLSSRSSLVPSKLFRSVSWNKSLNETIIAKDKFITARYETEIELMRTIR